MKIVESSLKNNKARHKVLVDLCVGSVRKEKASIVSHMKQDLKTPVGDKHIKRHVEYYEELHGEDYVHKTTNPEELKALVHSEPSVPASTDCIAAKAAPYTMNEVDCSSNSSSDLAKVTPYFLHQAKEVVQDLIGVDCSAKVTPESKTKVNLRKHAYFTKMENQRKEASKNSQSLKNFFSTK